MQYSVVSCADARESGQAVVTDQPVARPRRVRAGNREPHDVRVKGNVVGKALEGVRVLDMTHVPSGPSCTQILVWMGADVVKLEAPGGDITRMQLRDIPDVDSLYFTMLRLPDETVRLPGRRPSLPPAGRTQRGHLRPRTRPRRPTRQPQGQRDSCRSASCDHRRVPTSVDKTDMTSKFQ
jgi:hypothetical protein